MREAVEIKHDEPPISIMTHMQSMVLSILNVKITPKIKYTVFIKTVNG